MIGCTSLARVCMSGNATSALDAWEQQCMLCHCCGKPIKNSIHFLVLWKQMVTAASSMTNIHKVVSTDLSYNL